MISARRRAYINSNIFALGIAIAVVLGSVFFWTISDQNSSSIRVAFGALSDLWTGIYFAGGLFAVVGILWASPRTEFIGKALLAAAFTLQGTALIFVIGARAVPNALLLYLIAVACVIRARLIIKAWRIERAAMNGE